LQLRFDIATPTGIKVTDMIPCPLTDGTWSCVLPAGKGNLSLHSRPYISHFIWERMLPASGNVDVGGFIFRTGTSVYGTIETADGTAADNVKVSLLPPFVVEDRAGTTKSALTNKFGFFHVVDAAPGHYEVNAERGGWTTSGAAIDVLPETEVKVLPMRLEEPRRLEVWLDPPVSSDGVPWSIDLVAARRAGMKAVLTEARPDAEGRLVHPGLPSGRYSVMVKRRGARWAQRFITLPEESVVTMFVRERAILGRVRVGRGPLREGAVILGSRQGSVSVPLPVNDDGEFEGVVPPDAADRTWVIEIDGKVPPVRRVLSQVKLTPPTSEADPIRLDLDLPGTTLRGEVHNEDGTPVTRGLVRWQTLAEPDRPFFAVIEAGRFAMSGLQPGGGSLRVDTPDGASENQTVHLSEDSATDVSVRVRRLVSLKGSVVDREGRPVPGALLRVVPVQSAGLWFQPPLQTTRDGRFEAKIPSGTREVLITAGAVGYTLRLVRAGAESDVAVVLDRFGGTLALKYKHDRQDPSSPAPLLVADGASDFVDDYFHGWAAVQPVAGTWQGDGISLPNVAPGRYSLCLVTIRERVASGADAQPSRCTTGDLLPGGTLTLEP
jgi:hypothetical protein